MRIRLKRAAIVFLAILIVVLVTVLPGAPWSARAHHTLERAIAKAEIRFARWRGQNPRLASIKGRVNSPGLQIEALDSRSGFAGLADNEGNFVLPDVMWYPEATFELVITDGDSVGRLIEITAPHQLPENGEFNVGELDIVQGTPVNVEPLIGLNSITLDDFDSRNSDYYKKVFDRLTAGEHSDEDRVAAINDYVATRLNYDETQWELGSPRRVLERGSEYCGHLGTAMQTLLSIGGYTARAVHMSDGNRPPGTHVVVEVLYRGAWHLYDPTFGLKFLKKDGEVASYKDVRLDTSLISEDLLARFPHKVRRELMTLLPAVYGTGYHHYFYFRGQQWNASKARPLPNQDAEVSAGQRQFGE
jgi:hypothetical protein